MTFDQKELYINENFFDTYTDSSFINRRNQVTTTTAFFRDSQISVNNFANSGPSLFKLKVFTKSNQSQATSIFSVTHQGQVTDYTLAKRGGRNMNFEALLSTDELYVDSLLPSPVEIYRKNDGKFVIVDSSQKNLDLVAVPPDSLITNPYVVLEFEEKTNLLNKIPNGRAAIMYMGNNFVSPSWQLPGPGIPIADNFWSQSYPFEKRYKNLTRYKKPTFSTEDLVLKEEIKTTYTTDFSDNAESFTRLHERPQTIRSTSVNLGFEKVVSICFFFDGTLDLGVIGIDAMGQCNHYNGIIQQYFANYAAMPTTKEENYRLFFGFGTGKIKSFVHDTGEQFDNRVRNYFHIISEGTPNGAPSSLTYNVGQPKQDIRGILFQHLGISGYKYGIINHLPFPTKLIFRRGRYGQFRDLLEQRLFSKMYDNEREEPLEAVAVARFLPGTEADIVSKTGYISTEPGYFNREYQSVKPFADDVFPTFIEETPLSSELVIV